MSKAECEAALAKSAYVEALQAALDAKLESDIRSEFDPKYSPELQFRPSMRCGSLVMEAVVEDTFALQLRQHYSSGGNVLKLEVAGQPLLFVPKSTTTTPSRRNVTGKGCCYFYLVTDNPHPRARDTHTHTHTHTPIATVHESRTAKDSAADFGTTDPPSIPLPEILVIILVSYPFMTQ